MNELDPVNLALDPGWGAGLVLATTRVGAFVAASPILGRAVPLPGRLALVLALGLFLAAPIAPPEGPAPLIAAVVVNAGVGIVLGFLTGLVFHLFAVAGSLVDLTSGLSVAALYDPSQGEQTAVFGRLFNLVALTLFAAVGGLGLLVRGLAASVVAVPLDGAVTPDAGLVELTLRLVGQMTVAAMELALPVLASLFLAEVVLGLAGRLAPQANVLLLGLPAKLLVTVSVLSVTLLLFPEAVGGLLSAVEDAFGSGLRGLRPV